MTYTEIKKEYVIETLAKGAGVLMCDFHAMRITDCATMTIGAILNFLDLDCTKFFKVVADE